MRASVGTTFQIPQFRNSPFRRSSRRPSDGYINIGNPTLQPDRATEYGLGFEHFFGAGDSRTHVSLDLYRTNLRNPATTLVPPLSNNPDCGNSSADALLRTKAAATPACPLSYPVNVGNAVYQGFELRSRPPIRRLHDPSRRIQREQRVPHGGPARRCRMGPWSSASKPSGCRCRRARCSIDRRPPLGLSTAPR